MKNVLIVFIICTAISSYCCLAIGSIYDKEFEDKEQEEYLKEWREKHGK